MLIVAAVMAATLMQTLDSTVTNVALPTIQGNVGTASRDPAIRRAALDARVACDNLIQSLTVRLVTLPPLNRRQLLRSFS